MGSGISIEKCREKYPYTKTKCRDLYECPSWTREECSAKYPTSTVTQTDWTQEQCSAKYPASTATQTDWTQEQCYAKYPCTETVCPITESDYNYLQRENDANISEITRLTKEINELRPQTNWSREKCQSTYPENKIITPTPDIDIIKVRTTPPTGYSQGVCKTGYYDKTKGKYNTWACGKDCIGGSYRTDGSCNCACIPNAQDP